MCFHTFRFETRKNDTGETVLYHAQDEHPWNRELIAKGAYCLHLSAQGSQLSKYHFKANIAYWHTVKEDTK
jgi:predicted RNA polymerase sigma factor